MSVILQNTEETCRRIQTLLESLNSSAFSVENYEMLHIKLKIVMSSISRSKKKIMVRTEKGKELSTNAHNVANELENAILQMENPSLIPELSDKVITLLTQLEKEASKIETYWKMYEAAIT